MGHTIVAVLLLPTPIDIYPWTYRSDPGSDNARRTFRVSDDQGCCGRGRKARSHRAGKWVDAPGGGSILVRLASDRSLEADL